jgi:hypothetical protein
MFIGSWGTAKYLVMKVDRIFSTESANLIDKERR